LVGDEGFEPPTVSV